MIGDRLLRVAHHAFVILLVVGAAIVLSAQTVVDPRYVEFTPSADHNTLASDGTPLVQRYSLSVFPAGSSTATATTDLGKPTPSGGIIRVDLLQFLQTIPTGVVFEARVTAVGPGGSTASSVSNGFSFQAACAPTLNSTSQSVGSGATSGSVGVTAGSGCTWSAVSNAAWITLSGATSGTGNGTVPYNVAANASTSARSGTLTVAGQTYTVNQAALSCSYSLTPASQSVAAGGGTGSTNVTAPTGCAWTGVSNHTSWLTVTSGASGNGNGTLAFSASSNPNTIARTGTITIGGQTFSVTQAATACTFALLPASQSVAASGGTGSTTVTTLAGCAWTGVSNNTSWLTVTSGGSGNGAGTVGFSAAANPNGTQRSGSLTIAGQTFSVTQAAAPCTYAINPASQSVAAAGGTGSTTVTAPTGCAWTGVSNNTSWLTVTSGASGNGGGSVGFSAAVNASTTQRSGTLTIGGQTLTVTQAAAGCTYSINPTSQSVAAAGGAGSATVTTLAGCAWTGVSNSTSWLTVTSGASGNGTGTVAFSTAANPNGTARSGSLTIAGQTFSVTQAAAPCTYAINPASQSVAAAGGTGSTTVTAPTGCAWTGVSNNTSWLTVTSGASGNGGGSVGFSAAANASTTQRSGTLTIGGQTLTVTQAAAPCTYSISPTSQTVGASAANGSTTVTAPAGCSWTSVSNDTGWLTVTSGATGSGGGSVGFSASGNASTTQRVGTLTVAGQTLTVTQAGVGCTFTLSANTLSVAASAGTGSSNVTAPAGCPWSASSNVNWITVTSGASGNGNGSTAFSVAANPDGTARSGTLTIAAQTFTVSQAAAACTYSLSPTSQMVAASGGGGSTTLTTLAGCAWTAASTAPGWLAVSGTASGSGTATVSFTAAANTSTQSRAAALTIGGQSFTVNQAGVACTVSISPASTTIGSGAGSGLTNVTAGTGCAWTAVSNASWLTVSGGGGGTGSALVTFNATANTATQSRTATITIGAETFTVTQNASACAFSISPTTQTVAAGGGNGSATVTTTTGCSWTAASSAAWITVTTGATGSGAGTATFTIAPSTSTTQRTGSLMIAGRLFTVTQSANTCTYTLTPASRTHIGAGGSGTITVGTSSGCAWQATTTQAWISVSGNGTASGSVSYTVQPNTTGASRTGSISIGTQVFSVVQTPGGGTAPVTPAGLRILAIGGSD